MKRGIIFFVLLEWFCPVFAFAATPAQKHGCVSCHRFSAKASLESRKGPDLYYAGNKFQKPWLEKFLQKPVVIRKAGFFLDPGFLEGKPVVAPPHASLSAKDAKEMADYLLSLKISGLVLGKVGPEPLSRGQRVRVKILFERNYGCIACHESINLAGQRRGGVSGPSLANAGNRLQADWVFNWLKTPELFIEKSRMPKYAFDDETAIKLTKFIMSLKDSDWK